MKSLIVAGGLREHPDDSRGVPVPDGQEEEEVWAQHGGQLGRRRGEGPRPQGRQAADD